MFTIYQSNHVENLLEGLGASLAQPLADPLIPEVIAVQHQGMAHWLSLELAGKFGICANVQFAFPATIIWKLFAALGWTGPGMEVYRPEGLTWAVMAELDSLPDLSTAGLFKENLAGEDLALQRYQVARRVAKCFDRYMAFRPDWIRKWEGGEDDHWQARLWRRLRDVHGDGHRASQLFALLEKVDEELISRAGLPERLSLFGIPSLSVAQLEVFSRLAEWLDVRFYLFNPCRSFWDDILSDGELAKRRLVDEPAGGAFEDFYCEVGNPLLASLGKQGREFQRLLHGRDYDEIDDFREPGNSTLLAVVQSDILNGCRRQNQEDKIELAVDDDSIQIHVAHSPMREVEILHDRLLAMFAAAEDGTGKELTPGDVLVMTPDIALYSPFIEAVFANPEREEDRVPFSVADRSHEAESVVVRTFFDLLRIGEGRLPASQVLGLLDVAPLRRRFGIRLDELEIIRGWVRDTGINWGVDEGGRQAMGLPATRRGSWKSGVERLLLGHAMGGQERLFRGVLPYDGIDESSADLLGRFASFLDLLFASRKEIVRSRSWPAWHPFLLEMIDRFIEAPSPSSEGGADLQIIRNGLADAVHSAEGAGFKETIGIEVVAAHLQAFLDLKRRGGAFLAGRLTFCQMVPMRSIPFKLICLLGMEDGAFPRIEHWPSFDLMAGDYRLGDRLQRDDDRYLFLETLLSARRLFYISYVGRSIRDDLPLPPSTVVDELLDYVRRSCKTGDRDIATRLVTVHPLQPFSRRYFSGDGELFTYSKTARQVAVALGGARSCGGLFGDGMLAASAEDVTLSLPDFVSFLSNPTRYLLKRRLGLYLDEQDDDVADRELFSLNHLQRYKLTEQLGEAGLAGEDLGFLYDLSIARGTIPEGEYGNLEFHHRAAVAGEFVMELQRQRAGHERGQTMLEVDLRFDNIRLTGQLQNVWGNTQCLFRPAKVKSQGLTMRDMIEHWLYHLVFSVVAETEAPRSVFIGLDGRVEYEPVASARRCLCSLVDWYRRGMTEPLPLFSKTSLVYANSLWRPKKRGNQYSPVQALERARRTWQQGDFQAKPSTAGECLDPYFLTAFGDSDPLSLPLFHEVAEGVLGEALRNQQR